MSAQHYDAVVVGAGPNGLVAANHLADAGWSVLVLEAQPEVGGAVRSDRGVHPDYVHDTFSAFYPLAAISPTIRSFGLEEHGLSWRHAPAVLGHPLPDGRWAVLHRDRSDTAHGLDELHPGDGEAWLELCAQWDRIEDPLLRTLLAAPVPIPRLALQRVVAEIYKRLAFHRPGDVDPRVASTFASHFADRATTWPTGPATPYERNAVAKRHLRASGLRIGEQTACRIRLPCAARRARPAHRLRARPGRQPGGVRAAPRPERPPAPATHRVVVNSAWCAAPT